MSTRYQAPWSAPKEAILALQSELLAMERQASPLLAEVHAEQRASAVNLLHYLALRQHNLWDLQEQLATLGLSSLGRSEAHVLATLQAVLRALDALASGALHTSEPDAAVTREAGQALLQQHVDCLFGPPPPHRRVRVMVTLATKDAEDPAQIHELVRCGMDCARINAAHDDPSVWRALARNVRDAARSLDRPCQIAVDLPGPKCRTGPLQPGPKVLKLRPRRGPSGKVVSPARAWLTSVESDPRTPALPVSPAFLETLRPNATLTMRDARGRLRSWRVATVVDGAVEILSEQTSYVHEGALLHGPDGQAAVGPLPALELPLVLYAGDLLALTRAETPGGPARRAFDGSLLAPAHIPCHPPELIDMVRANEAVWLDDGRIGGVIASVEPEAILVRITSAATGGAKLRADKGINLPDSKLTLSPFTASDAEALAFAAEAADIVSLSFVREPADVRALQDRLTALARPDLAIILKIETRAGFERLPELLLAAMRSAKAGVMIARGDLGVECGFERLAEVQEEILWLCEAAHMPVVWATQVLETLAKSGRPTRAEVTDAAMAERAECVMLNKGPYIAQAVTLLDNILRRMSGHQDKKSAMFRALDVARLFQQHLERLPSGPN